ncbi:diacylglycerol O-acyltransferase 3-like isoform X2 [Salvia splendens]|uniref:diacylglycerol O-acyltransferase 3-like isoform X2 n=1 Tax=Salvia splendens TaxID=180675 RepID=UPI001C279C1D|nr:diacylglycerol O-acyltransferase 3-like isoform X2 [Salvia splendens]
MVLQQPIRFPNVAGAAAASSPTKELGNSSGKFVQLRRWRAKNRVLSSGFCDRSQLQYYKCSFDSAASTVQDAEVEGVSRRQMSGKEKSVKKMKKKQLKLLKKLKLLDRMNGNMITKVKAEEKEARRRTKEEKAVANSEMPSSSSSSESSDNECGEAVGMSGAKVKRLPIITEAAPAPVSPSKRIEVCMGGKCKKSGAGALLEEFRRAVGAEEAVSGCKCMGKCRDGPNVKLVGPAAADSLRIGVGLEDVDVIMAKFFDEHQQQQ